MVDKYINSVIKIDNQYGVKPMSQEAITKLKSEIDRVTRKAIRSLFPDTDTHLNIKTDKSGEDKE